MWRFAIVGVALLPVACGEGIVGAPEQLSIEANATRVGESSVKTIVTITNTSNETIQAGIGGVCPFTLLVYADPSAAGTPVWNQGDWRRARNVACTYIMPRTTLAPGESADYQTTVAASDILGDRLAAGQYHFVAAVNVDEQVVRLPAGELELSRD